MARSSSSTIESGLGVVAAKPRSPVRPDVRSDLLGAAHQLWCEHGVQALTQQRVAASAGVRQSHLTYYFPTRNDLLRAVVQDAMVALLELLELAPPESAARPANLARLRNVMMDRFLDRAGSRLWLALAVACEEDLTLRPWLTKFNADVRRRLHRVFANVGVHPASDNLFLFQASLMGAVMLDLNTATEASARQARMIVGQAFDCLVSQSFTQPVESTQPHDIARSGRSWP